MRLIIRLAGYLILAVLFALVVNKFGFVVAHSGPLIALLALVSPGVFVIFFAGGLGESLGWTLFICLNVVYYELLYKLVLRRFWTKRA